MPNTATTYLMGTLASHLRERNLTAAGLGYASLKLAFEQLTDQLTSQVLHNVGRVLDTLPVGQLHPVDVVMSQATMLLSRLDGTLVGLLGTLVTLVWPVGGPMWAGLVPVRVVSKGARSFGRVLAAASIPATCNAQGWSIGQSGAMPISVLIVDDSPPFLNVAQRLLTRDGIDVVGVASTGAEAVAKVLALSPQVALIDLQLGGESGFDVARQVAGCGQSPGPYVVLMSTHTQAEFADLLTASPAAGFVPKEKLSGAAIRAAIA